MGLTITYRDGSLRLLNPISDFYKDSPSGIRDKVEKLCHDTGILFNAKVFDGTKVRLEIEHVKNKPYIKKVLDVKSSRKARINNRRAVKEHQRNLNNPQFSIIIKEGVPYKIADLRLARKQARNK